MSYNIRDFNWTERILTPSVSESVSHTETEIDNWNKTDSQKQSDRHLYSPLLSSGFGILRNELVHRHHSSLSCYLVQWL